MFSSKTKILILLCGVLFVIGCSQSENSKRKPNIILIMSDDMGYSDIGCYGSEIKTPNLDGLAGNGLRFTQFYNTSRCCPTRASLLTGLYPHQAGIGHMMRDRGTDGYRGDLSDKSLTIAQVLKTAGYSTYMAGKWHVTPLLPTNKNPSKHNWPLQRGFDRFFGTIHGAGSFYDPNSLTSGNTFIAPEEGFYYTDAISDTAVSFINDHSSENPFFMYVSYTAAHWPLQAPPKDIAKYKGVYDKGWDELRKERYQRMIRMGIIDEQWKLSEPTPIDNKWEDTEMKDWQAACMEVYAAMIDNMDQGIGRIVSELKMKGEMDNTLILFLQDNGACAEQWGFWRKNEIDVDPDTLKRMAKGELQYRMQPKQTRDGRPVRSARGVYPGPTDTYVGYDIGWANASNTPFRMYKHWVNEGGISSPLIVHWPNKIKTIGALRNQYGHLIDVMATCVDVSGAVYPKTLKGKEIIPMQGMSLLPLFEPDEQLNRGAVYWEHEGNRAIRNGKWKLVSKPNLSNSFVFDKQELIEPSDWQLYDIERDRTESNDMASQNPELVNQMAQNWYQWAKDAKVIPKPIPNKK